MFQISVRFLITLSAGVAKSMNHRVICQLRQLYRNYLKQSQ